MSDNPIAFASDTTMVFSFSPIFEPGDILANVCWSKSRAMRAFTFACISSPSLFSGVDMGAAVGEGTSFDSCGDSCGDSCAAFARSISRIWGDGMISAPRKGSPGSSDTGGRHEYCTAFQRGQLTTGLAMLASHVAPPLGG